MISEEEDNMFDKKNKKKRYITLFILVLVLINAFQTYGQSKNFDLFAVSDLVKVFEDGHNCPHPKGQSTCLV